MRIQLLRLSLWHFSVRKNWSTPYTVCVMSLEKVCALVAIIAIYSCSLSAQQASTTTQPKPADQNPSPMVEFTRTHSRIAKMELPGQRVQLSLGTLFIPAHAQRSRTVPLVVHFHGASWLAEWSASRPYPKAAVLSVNLGAGSGVYSRAFSDPNRFEQLLDEAARAINPGSVPSLRPVILSGFSAGYGAIREILKQRSNWQHVSAVVLIDGLHASYQTGNTPGPLETESLQPFVDFAREAMAGRKRMVITHSEVFPGTFASTTETNDYLISTLGLKRKPVVKWGPGGMQQLSDVRSGGFHVLGFAGNSAPDHIDQLHGMEQWLKLTR